MTTSHTTKIRNLAFGAALLVLAVFGYWWTHKSIQSTDDAYVEADVAVISPEVEGLVTQLNFTAHQSVKAGDVLVQLDDARFKAALAIATATQDKAIASLAEAEANLEQAHNDFARAQRLANTNVGSRQSLDDAGTELKQSEARVAEAKAEIALATATRDQAQIDLDRTTIRAPFDGHVGEPAVQPGTFVRTGSQLVMLVPMQLHVIANFKETQIAHMKEGQIAELRFDSLPGKAYEGHIVSFSPGTGSTFALLPPENATGNFTKIVQRVPVRISLPDDAEMSARLRSGLSVEVRVDTGD